jgi:hypothetical protein
MTTRSQERLQELPEPQGYDESWQHWEVPKVRPNEQCQHWQQLALATT